MVLLGDIFEFWAPLEEKKVLESAYKVIDKILEIKDKGCEIVYVIGNHDTIMSRYEGRYEGAILHDFRIVPCHLETDVPSAQEESVKFVFTHGDAFEWGRTKGITTKLMGYAYRIASDLTSKGKAAVVLSFIALYLIFWHICPQFRSTPLVRDLSAVILGALGLYAVPSIGRYLGWLVIGIPALIRPAPAGDAVLAAMRSVRKPTLTEKFRYAGADLDKKVRRLTLQRQPRYKSFEEVLNGSLRSLYWSLEHWWKENYQNASRKPDVIVFGHTHTPEGPSYVRDIPTRKKLDEELKETILVNAGSWLKEKDEVPSFLFIDGTGKMMLCEFDGKIGIERGNTTSPWTY